MPFELLSNPSKTKSGVDIARGASVRWRQSNLRNGTKSFYVHIMIGELAAKSLSLQAEKHKLAVMFGNGADKGKLAVTVDNSAGQFPCKRTKTNNYQFTIPASIVDGRFKPDFPAIELEKIEIVKLDPTKPVFGLIDISTAVA